MTLYSLEDIRITHGARTILDIAHLELRTGRAYSLQGPNGAGKSTLLGILAFLDAPHAGRLSFENKPVIWKESHLRPLRRLVGVVEQHPVLFSRTVRENVAFALALRGVHSSQRIRLVNEALALVGLTALADAPAMHLSGGETQRAALARALVSQPRILLLDEPTANVDRENRVIIEQVVAELRDQGGTTIIFCTHNRAQAWVLCPEVLHLEGGCLVVSSRVNIYVGQCLPDLGICRIADNFCVPAEPSSTTSLRRRVALDPQGVRLVRASAPGPNQGVVSEVRLEGDHLAVTVDLGRPLCLQMSRAAFQASGLAVADVVQVDIAPEAVEFFPIT